MSKSAADADRRIANMIEIGTVTEVNGQTGRARVQLGDVVTPEIKVGNLAAGPLSFWWMPAVGDQVVVAAPGGDLGQGVIVSAIFQGNAPSGDAGTPKIDLNSGGGSMEIDGTLRVSRDVIINGISFVDHVHGGVYPGPADTDVPK